MVGAQQQSDVGLWPDRAKVLTLPQERDPGREQLLLTQTTPGGGNSRNSFTYQ